jgi:poly(3-hydroxybutyrate) depolymerase
LLRHIGLPIHAPQLKPDASNTDTELNPILLEAEMDQVWQEWGNMFRSGARMSGLACQSFGQMLKLTPMGSPFSENWINWGRFLEEKNQPVTPHPWMTGNRIVYKGMKTALRKFNADNRGNPILLVAPEAGHNSQIVDYGPGQSLVQCALIHFDGDVYVMDKLPAGPEDKDYSLDDCIRAVDACIQHIGEPVHLVGLCQGGWQCAIYTALFPQQVKTLCLAAAPIDFHAGDAVITQWARSLPESFFESMVAMGGGLMPGACIVSGFMLMNPVDRFLGDDLDLLRNIADPVFLERYRRFNRWYQFTQSLPGRLYLQVVNELFKGNSLVRGSLQILGQRVDLSRIDHPLYLIAGSKDDITPQAQLFAISEHASSASVEKHIAAAGHIGVFMGAKVIREIWSGIFQRLSQWDGDHSADTNGVVLAQASSF